MTVSLAACGGGGEGGHRDRDYLIATTRTETLGVRDRDPRDCERDSETNRDHRDCKRDIRDCDRDQRVCERDLRD